VADPNERASERGGREARAFDLRRKQKPREVVVGNETESEKENRIVARKNTLEGRTKKRRNEETWRRRAASNVLPRK
jgi:hypothetical protein